MGSPDGCAELAAPPSEPAGARILVIDDEEVVHAAVKRMLARGGHDVVSARSAREGLALVDAHPFDLLITDLMMPEMDGLELLNALRIRRLKIPVLMVTGYPTISTALKALRLGAADYLTKPFTRREFLGPVSRSLRGLRDDRRVGGSRSITEELRGATEPTPSADGIEPPPVDLRPGARVCLPRHAWAVYCEDGTVEVGVDAVFLRNSGAPSAIELPPVAQLVEQGFVGIRLSSASGETHGVFMPLSGIVVEHNGAAASSPLRLRPDTWLVRVLPTHLDRELHVLLRDHEPDAH